MPNTHLLFSTPIIPRAFSTVPNRLPTIRTRHLNMSTRPSALVSPAWVASQSPLTLLDASWYMPSLQRKPQSEYFSEHIPNARYFDIDAPGLADKTSNLPHMVPEEHQFAVAAARLGVDNQTPVVVYARRGFVGAARAWWMLRLFGKENVYLLNGGLEAWKKEGRPIDSGKVPDVEDGTFAVKKNEALVKSMDDMLAQIRNKEGVIVDARSKGRFHGTSPEPRAGLLGGHMPGAFCVPSGLLTDEEGKMRGVNELRSIFQESGLDGRALINTPFSLTCGSGVTAAINCVALYELGVDAAVYDGSWSEYGSHHNNPLATNFVKSRHNS